MKCIHFKALMKKNWINWKRTLCGSLSEIICPLLLIGILIAVKGLFETEIIPASILYENASLQTPVQIKRGDNLQLEEDLRQLADFNQPLMDFSGKGKMFQPRDNCDRRANSGNPCREWKNEGLDQQLMGLQYEHCYESDRQGKLDSDIVGIIHNGNEVGEQIEKEINRLSEYQKQVYDQKLKQYIQDNGPNFNPKEMDRKQLSNLKALGRKPLEFKIKNFISKQEMFDFIQAPDYRSPTQAGLCFGILVDQLSNNEGYNVEIFMNDQEGEGPFRSLPTQIKQPFDFFISNPDLTNFNFYTKNGYSKLHNWVANSVLR